MKLQLHRNELRNRFVDARVVTIVTLPHRSQRGMSLIEVLVALVVFALSMLGSGALLVTSLRSGQHSLYATNVTMLAQEYGDLMQTVPASANSTGTTVLADNWFLIDTDVTGDSAKPYFKGGVLASTIPDCQSTACTPAQMATRSIWDWSQRVQAALPGARVVVCRDTQPKDSSGYYQWSCDNTGGLIVAKFGWISKKMGTGDDVLSGVDAATGKPMRPNIVMTLFGNQTDFAVPTAP